MGTHDRGSDRIVDRSPAQEDLITFAFGMAAGIAVGLALFRVDAVTLLGAMTSTPALDMVNRLAGSSLPSIGYAGTYAFANVLMAAAGSLLMRL
jgi:putative transport protein